MDTPNSQKKSPRSSAKSKQNTTGTPEPSHQSKRSFEDHDDEDKYVDFSIDQVARVRAAKEAAQRQMESFGDISEYDVTIIQGQMKKEPTVVSQSSLDFQPDTDTEKQEGD